MTSGLHRKIAVQVRRDPDVETARELPVGQRDGHVFSVGGQVAYHLVDERLQPGQCLDLSRGQPGQRRQFEAGGDELAVFRGPGRRGTCSARYPPLPFASSSFLLELRDGPQHLPDLVRLGIAFVRLDVDPRVAGPRSLEDRVGGTRRLGSPK